ncbi:MAG: RNA polymerase sigma-70 factor [Alloprevotella sp.]|nr:RNA polymerase sigma-70 factor [Alloprevotella sp.]
MKRTLDYLIKPIANGDIASFETLYRYRYADLCGWAWQIVGSKEKAEEVVDDVFTQVWKNRSTLSTILHIDSYLYAAVRNSCLNELKSKSRRQENNTLSVDADIDVEILAEAFHDENDGYEQYAFQEVQTRLAEAIDSFPEKMRNVFVQSRREGLTMDEIAVRNDISANTVRYHLKEALSRLRQVLRSDK